MSKLNINFFVISIAFNANLKLNFNIGVFTRNSSVSRLNVRNSTGFKVSWNLRLWAA